MDREFYEQVKLMREHQKEFFKTKSKAALIESKQYERRVDIMIGQIETANEMLNPKTAQQ